MPDIMRRRRGTVRMTARMTGKRLPWGCFVAGRRRGGLRLFGVSMGKRFECALLWLAAGVWIALDAHFLDIADLEAIGKRRKKILNYFCGNKKWRWSTN